MAASAECSVESGGEFEDSVNSEKEDDMDGEVAIIENLIEIIVSVLPSPVEEFSLAKAGLSSLAPASYPD